MRYFVKQRATVLKRELPNITPVEREQIENVVHDRVCVRFMVLHKLNDGLP
jgi:hypothetical protein